MASGSVEKKIGLVVLSLQEYDPERIILFGSCARRDANEYSDIDIIVVKETEDRFLDRLRRVYQLIKPSFAMDVLVYTPEELKEMQRGGNHFVEEALSEGIVIYERRPA